MRQPTVTTSVCLHWWLLGQASMFWTKEDAAPCTMLLRLTPRESRFALPCWAEFERIILLMRSLYSVRCVEYLLRNGADPGVNDRQGCCAVHYASAYGRTLCLELVGPSTDSLEYQKSVRNVETSAHRLTCRSLLVCSIYFDFRWQVRHLWMW